MQAHNLLKILQIEEDKILQNAIEFEDYQIAYDRLEVLSGEEKIPEIELGKIFCLVQSQKITQAQQRLDHFNKKDYKVTHAVSDFHDYLTAQINYAQLPSSNEENTELFSDRCGKIISLAEDLSYRYTKKIRECKEENETPGSEAIYDLVAWMRRQVGDIVDDCRRDEKKMREKAKILPKSILSKPVDWVSLLLEGESIANYLSDELTQQQRKVLADLIMSASDFYQKLSEDQFENSAFYFYFNHIKLAFREETSFSSKNISIYLLNKNDQVKFVLRAINCFKNENPHLAVSLYSKLLKEILGCKLDIKLDLTKQISLDPPVISEFVNELIHAFLEKLTDKINLENSSMIFRIGFQLAELSLCVAKPDLEKLDILINELQLMRENDPAVSLLRARYYHLANDPKTEDFYIEIFNSNKAHFKIGLAYFNFMRYYLSPNYIKNDASYKFLDKLFKEFFSFYSRFPIQKESIILHSLFASSFVKCFKNSVILNGTALLNKAINRFSYYAPFYYYRCWLEENRTGFIVDLESILSKIKSRFDKNSILGKLYLNEKDNQKGVLQFIGVIKKYASTDYFPDFSRKIFSQIPEVMGNFNQKKSDLTFLSIPLSVKQGLFIRSVLEWDDNESDTNLKTIDKILMEISKFPNKQEYFTIDLSKILLEDNDVVKKISSFIYTPNSFAQSDFYLKILRTNFPPAYLASNSTFNINAICEALFLISQGFNPNAELDRAIKNFKLENEYQFELAHVRLITSSTRQHTYHALANVIHTYNAKNNFLGYAYDATSDTLNENFSLLRDFIEKIKGAPKFVLGNNLDKKNTLPYESEHGDDAWRLSAEAWIRAGKVLCAISNILRKKENWKESKEAVFLIAKCYRLIGQLGDFNQWMSVLFQLSLSDIRKNLNDVNKNIQLDDFCFLLEPCLFNNPYLRLTDCAYGVSIKNDTIRRMSEKFQDGVFLQPGFLFHKFEENFSLTSAACRLINVTFNPNKVDQNKTKLPPFVLPLFTIDAVWLFSDENGQIVCVNPLSGKQDLDEKILRFTVPRLTPVVAFSQPSRLIELLFYMAQGFTADNSIKSALENFYFNDKNNPAEKEKTIQLCFDYLDFLMTEDKSAHDEYWDLLIQYQIDRILPEGVNAAEAKAYLEGKYKERNKSIVNMDVIFKNKYFDKISIKDCFSENQSKNINLEDLASYAKEKYKKIHSDKNKKKPKKAARTSFISNKKIYNKNEDNKSSNPLSNNQLEEEKENLPAANFVFELPPLVVKKIDEQTEASNQLSNELKTAEETPLKSANQPDLKKENKRNKKRIYKNKEVHLKKQMAKEEEKEKKIFSPAVPEIEFSVSINDNYQSKSSKSKKNQRTSSPARFFQPVPVENEMNKTPPPEIVSAAPMEEKITEIASIQAPLPEVTFSRSAEDYSNIRDFFIEFEEKATQAGLKAKLKLWLVGSTALTIARGVPQSLLTYCDADHDYALQLLEKNDLESVKKFLVSLGFYPAGENLFVNNHHVEIYIPLTEDFFGGTRDTTISAIHVKLNDARDKFDICDIYDGLEDFEKSIIRLLRRQGLSPKESAKKILEEDPCRVLRAFKFMASYHRLHFKLDWFFYNALQNIQWNSSEIHSAKIINKINKILNQLKSSQDPVAEKHFRRLLDQHALLKKLPCLKVPLSTLNFFAKDFISTVPDSVSPDILIVSGDRMKCHWRPQ